MNNRRIFCSSLAASALPAMALAQSDDADKMLGDAITNAGREEFLGVLLPPPNDPIWGRARAILNAAPHGPTPYAVAQYFLNRVPKEFQQAWPQPDAQHPTLANPLIVLFFLATKTKPAGDTTPWCAAFANWCLARAGVTGTGLAGSQSFLNWGNKVWDSKSGGAPDQAKQGDMAVFSLKSDPGHGHVAFFDDLSASQANHVEVLGGNQIQAGVHLIDIKTLRTNGNLYLAEIRTKKGLRHA